MSNQEGISLDQTANPGIDEKLATTGMLETLAELGDCSAILGLINSAGLGWMLDRVGLQTFFAPANDSLAGFDGDAQSVERLLSRQMVDGAAKSEDLRHERKVTAMSGDHFPVHSDEHGLRIGEARIVRADVACTNGVIHVVDGLLIGRMSPK